MLDNSGRWFCCQNKLDLKSKKHYNNVYEYENGEGVKKNIDKAIEYYKMSIKAGDVEAITNLGYIYEKIKKDYAKAKELYESAAQQNEHRAC